MLLLAGVDGEEEEEGFPVLRVRDMVGLVLGGEVEVEGVGWNM